MNLEKLSTLGIKPLHGQYQPLDSDELARVSALLGTEIPPEYIDLVTRFGCAYFPGGGVTVRTVTPPPSHISNDGRLLVAGLFGCGGHHYSLLGELKLVLDEMPRQLLPF